MSDKQKYVIAFLPGEGFPSPFTFNGTISHNTFVEMLRAHYGDKLVLESAGTVQSGDFSDGSKISATPGSLTLNIGWSRERQAKDSELIRRRFGDL